MFVLKQEREIVSCKSIPVSLIALRIIPKGLFRSHEINWSDQRIRVRSTVVLPVGVHMKDYLRIRLWSFLSKCWLSFIYITSIFGNIHHLHFTRISLFFFRSSKPFTATPSMGIWLGLFQYSLRSNIENHTPKRKLPKLFKIEFYILTQVFKLFLNCCTQTGLYLSILSWTYLLVLHVYKCTRWGY